MKLCERYPDGENLSILCEVYTEMPNFPQRGKSVEITCCGVSGAQDVRSVCGDKRCL